MDNKTAADDGWFGLEVESDLRNLEVVGDFIAKTMLALGAKDEKDIFEVQLAVDEACTNIMEHAYSGKSGKITIQCKLSPNKKEFTIKLIDQGKPFDPNTVVPPDTEATLDQRKRGGYGIFFMNKLMQTVKYAFTEKGNELTMSKLLHEV
jgi:anti-sigma regulatory factor (Ser/Thr protein kinase)